MHASAYFHADVYHHAIDNLEAIARTFDPAAPDVLRTRIIEALGDLGIWPMTAFTGADEGAVIMGAESFSLRPLRNNRHYAIRVIRKEKTTWPLRMQKFKRTGASARRRKRPKR